MPQCNVRLLKNKDRYERIIFVGFFSGAVKKCDFFKRLVNDSKANEVLFLEYGAQRVPGFHTMFAAKFISGLRGKFCFLTNYLRAIRLSTGGLSGFYSAVSADFIHNRSPLVKKNRGNENRWASMLQSFCLGCLQNFYLIHRIINGAGLLDRVISSLNTSDKDLFVFFNSNFPSTRVIAECVARKGARSVFSEYGNIQGTMLFGGRGISSELSTVVDRERFMGLEVQLNEITAAKKIINETVKRQYTIKGKKDAWVPDSRIPREKRWVLYLETGLLGNGMLPRWDFRAKATSPYFKDNNDALRELAKVAKKNNWVIINKTHPNMPESLRSSVFDESVWDVGDVDIYSVIQQCSAVVLITSKVAQIALSLKCPVVLLGEMPLRGHGCCYEFEGQKPLGGLISEAIQGGVDDQQYKAFLNYVALELKYHLYWIGPPQTELRGRSRVPNKMWNDITNLACGGSQFDDV